MQNNTAPWYVGKPEELRRLLASLERHYPTLQTAQEEWGILIYGRFPVSAGGEIIDWYQIEIHLGSNFPVSLPVVFETGGRIRRDLNHHINRDDGSACLFTSEERHKHWPFGASFLNFLRRPLNEYFLSQFFYEQEGYWIFGDRRHGMDGPFEFYEEQLQVSERAKLVSFVQILCKTINPGRPCPCGENRIVNCHYHRLLQLQRRIPRTVFRAALVGVTLEEQELGKRVMQMEQENALTYKLPFLRELGGKVRPF